MSAAFYDVIVVGIGGIGGSALYHLAKSGAKVLGIDQFNPPHDRGSSQGSTRIIRQAYFENAAYIPLLKRAYTLWAEAEEFLGKELFHRNGLLILSDEPLGVGATAQKNAEAHGVRVERLSASEVRARYPQFSIKDDFYGVLEPGAGFLEVESCVDAHLKLAARAKAEIHANEVVLSWEDSKDGISLKTDRGTYQARKLIVCPGGWSKQLLGELGRHLSIKRAPQFWFRAPRGFSEADGMPCFAFARQGHFIYGFPHVEEWGLKVASYAPSTEIRDPFDRGPSHTLEELSLVGEYVRRFMPKIDPTPILSKICMYTLTPDEHFWLDWHPQQENVFIATGGSGHAFKFTSVLGEIVSKTVQNQPTGFDLNFLKYRW